MESWEDRIDELYVEDVEEIFLDLLLIFDNFVNNLEDSLILIGFYFYKDEEKISFDILSLVILDLLIGDFFSLVVE